MGQRLLEVHTELLVGFFVPWRDSAKGFEVINDPIPDDAKIVSVRQSPYYVNSVEIILSSPSWSDEPPRTRITPRCRAVEKKQGLACSCGVSTVSCGTCGSLVIDCPSCGRELQRP